MTNPTKPTAAVANPYDAAYWDARRAERVAQERQDADVARDIALDYERQAVLAEAVERIERAIARTDEFAARFSSVGTPDARINNAYYRGLAGGYEEALALLRGVITDRSAR